MVVNMLHNFSHLYHNHYRILKYVGFELIHYVINSDVVSSFMIFSEFDYLLLSNVLLV